MKKIGALNIPLGIKPYPEAHEIKIAKILVEYGKSVTFVQPRTSYKTKTFDILVDGVDWEMKSPQGTSKSTISRQLKRGRKQARHIIIDATRTKLDDYFIEIQIRRSLAEHRTIKRVILITKAKRLVEISR